VGFRNSKIGEPGKTGRDAPRRGYNGYRSCKTFIEMAELLESDLMEAMNRLEALEHHLKNSEVWEEFSQLTKHIDRFDTDSAVKSLQEIAQKLGISL